MEGAARPVRALVADFYGTLARATSWVSADEVLGQHGYQLSDEQRALYFADGLDGIEHDEHSRSRDHYVAWQRQRTLAMLAATDVHPDEYETIIEKLAAGATNRVLEAYDEVPGVLAKVRERGIRIVVCSNWDWDLREAVTESGLTDAVDALVSSAWVGARKPHPRIYTAALVEAGVEPDEVLFVGDTWGPDVVGPLESGFRPLYLRRDGHWPDGTAPPDPGEVTVGTDLTAALDLLG
ncbi:MAG: HAD family hydrolase [Acidimicrobiia bacterium]